MRDVWLWLCTGKGTQSHCGHKLSDQLWAHTECRLTLDSGHTTCKVSTSFSDAVLRNTGRTKNSIRPHKNGLDTLKSHTTKKKKFRTLITDAGSPLPVKTGMLRDASSLRTMVNLTYTLCQLVTTDASIHMQSAWIVRQLKSGMRVSYYWEIVVSVICSFIHFQA